MSADDIVLTANSVHALARQHAGSRDEWSRGFWIGLACAAAVHAVLIVGLARNAPRYLGDASGSPDAINVELVDEADLRSREAGGAESPPPGTPAPPPQPQAAQPQESPPPQPEAKPAEKTPTEQKAEQPAEAAPADQPASVLPVEKEKPQPAPPQQERAKESAQPKKAEAEPKPKMELKPPEQLDLSLPFSMTMKATPYEEFGRASAVNRPAGITRSGENDEFGRGVIRALKKTMPPATGTKGRVTIKLILDERGNIATVKLVQGAGITELDQGVVFSAQQASFPFPPKNSTAADRTFLITYVYK